MYRGGLGCSSSSSVFFSLEYIKEYLKKVYKADVWRLLIEPQIIEMLKIMMNDNYNNNNNENNVKFSIFTVDVKIDESLSVWISGVDRNPFYGEERRGSKDKMWGKHREIKNFLNYVINILSRNKEEENEKELEENIYLLDKKN